MKNMKQEIPIEELAILNIPKVDKDRAILRKAQMTYFRDHKHMTLEAIGRLYGITKQRVSQILKGD